ncbi:VOC family protein [Aggregatilinea lenta]|uniref:VOC family protein n=1 Tax=Aggregatilinea lenta TaxID=913108 RepID=UPI000E5BB601|nr:VOC family protein [Aggregatilinea lenta]
MSVFELRVALTTEEFDRIVAFYRDGLGLDPGDMWTDNGRGQILYAGRGVLEILDTEHAASVDQIEVGWRVPGQIRFAFQVPDVHVAVENALKYGATLIHEPVLTPWDDLNARVKSPDGLQITLFQVASTSA